MTDSGTRFDVWYHKIYPVDYSVRFRLMFSFHFFLRALVLDISSLALT